MQSLIFQDQDNLQRIRYLESNAADIVDDFFYERVLTDEDIAEEQAKFSELHIEIGRIEAEKAAAVAVFNADIKKRKLAAERALMLVKTKRQEVRETVYLIRDEEDNKIGTYNMHGELISEHPMQKTERGERQYRMRLPYKDNDETAETDQIEAKAS